MEQSTTKDPWQPIESAPRDGTYFLGVHKADGKDHLIPKYGVCCMTPLTPGVCWDWPWGMPPTHWMLLPPPPGDPAWEMGEGVIEELYDAAINRLSVANHQLNKADLRIAQLEAREKEMGVTDQGRLIHELTMEVHELRLWCPPEEQARADRRLKERGIPVQSDSAKQLIQGGQ